MAMEGLFYAFCSLFVFKSKTAIRLVNPKWSLNCYTRQGVI